MKRLLLLLILFAAPAFAQTQIQSGPVDPATCDPTLGQLWFNNSTIPAVLKYCSAVNTWSAVGGGTGATLFPWTVLSSSGTPSLNVTNGSANYYMSVTSNVTGVTFSGAATNGTYIGIDFQENGTGGFTIPTAAFPGNVIFPTGCTFNTAPNANNWMAWTSDGTNWQPVPGACTSSLTAAGAQGTVQMAGAGGSLAASSIFDDLTTVSIPEDVKIKGPNPYVDIRNFGAVAVNTSAIPYLPGITANCNASTTLTISGASTFVNGQGVAVANCGATNTMSTPAAPTVTSSLAATSTGTGYVVNGAAGGAETTCYVIVGIDKGQGLTLPSSETCVTGQARGKQTINLSSCVRSANTLVTCTTSSPHALAVGAWVNVHATNLDAEYGGWHILTAVADNTHFAYQWSRDSRAGASTVASSGGVVDYWQCNHLALPNPPGTGVWQYAIYRGASGAETFSDVSMIVNSSLNQDSSYMTWDDFGTTYTTATNRPWYIPNTPPGSATNDTLATTISSGAGSTTLTLANTASQTASGVTIVTDATPNYIAAATYALANHGMVYVPQVGSNYFATNTILDWTSYNAVGLSLSSSAWFGATFQSNTPTVRGDLPPAFLTLTQFSLEALTNITFSGAKPGIYTRGGKWSGLAFNPLGTNTQAFFIAAGNIPTGLFNDDAFLGASAGGDFASVPLIMFTQGQAGSASAGIKFDNIFTKGVSQGITPLIMSKNYGEVTFTGVMAGGRGYFFGNCPTCTGTGIDFNQQFETEALSMPMYTTRGPVGLNATGIEDTGSQPIVSHTGQGPLTLCVGASLPSGGIPQVTGANITSTTCSSLTDIQRGVNVNYYGILSPSFLYDGFYNTTQPLIEQNMHEVLGPGYSLFASSTASLPAPTCNVATAGPPFSFSFINGGTTANFAYTAVYPNGGQSIASGTVTCSMDGATQQATIVIPSQVNGAVGYYLLFGFGGGGASLGNYYTVQQNGLSILVPPGPQFLQGQSSPTLAGGGPAGIQNDKLWSGTFNLAKYMDVFETSAPANPSAGFERLYADSTKHGIKCLTGTGASCLLKTFVPYSANHTLNTNEDAVTATATLTFTLPHATIYGWDILSVSGTTTLSIDSGTLYGNGATGSFVIPAQQGVHAWCDGTSCYAYGLGGGGGGGSPGGTTNAFQYNGGGGAFAGVNSPVVNGNYNIHYRVTASASVAPSIDNPGVPINAQTGTTYTIGTGNTDFDRGYLITANNAGAQTYTMVNPSTTGYGFNHFYALYNIGTGAVTENAAGFTVNGGASLLVPPSWLTFHWSNGVNYTASRLPDFTAFPNCTGGGNALQFTLATGVFSCGSSASGVSSVSGDGTLINNVTSTGAVTLTIANAGAHKVWMNNTGSTAAPGYQSIGTADLPAVTVFNNQANTYSGGGLQDLSAMTWKVPTSAGCTASATNMLCYDSTNKNMHTYANNADAKVVAVTGTPTNGDLADYTVSSSNILAHDSGIATANVVTAASAATTANQTCVASGTSKTCTYIDFPEHLIAPAANCNNVTPASGWSLPGSNSPTLACRGGTNNLGGVLQWANNNTTTNAQFIFQLPFDWDTATQPYWNIIYGSGANTSGTIKWTISTACTKSDGSITDDPTFVAESTSTGKTMAVANRMWSENAQFANLISGNNCIAGSTVILKVTSGNGTATSTVNVEQMTITVPRLLTVQAN